MRWTWPLLLSIGCTTQQQAVVEAHQAGDGYFPANSQLAVEQALDAGYPSVSVDLVLTADGVPVLHESPFLTNRHCRYRSGEPLPAPIRVDSLTHAELVAQIRCGGIADPEHPNAQLRADTLMDFDSLVEILHQDHADTRIHLRLGYELGSTPNAETVVDAVLSRWFERDLPQRFAVSSSWPEAVAATIEQGASAGWDVDARLGWPLFRYSGADGTLSLGLDTVDPVREALDLGANGVVLSGDRVDYSLTRAASTAGLATTVGPIDDPARFDRMWTWPMDELATGYPADAR